MTDRTVDDVSYLPAAAQHPSEFVTPSLLQEQIWLAEQLAPDASIYGAPVAIHIRGSLDRELTARCLSHLVGRHESLRSRIAYDEDSIATVIDEPYQVNVGYIDLQEHRKSIQEILVLAASKPFNLEVDHPLRVDLIQLSDDEQILLLNIHHIVFDGWSLRILWREFVEIYSSWWSGREPVLHKPSARYVDFSIRQRLEINDGAVDAQLDYWRRELASPMALR